MSEILVSALVESLDKQTKRAGLYEDENARLREERELVVQSWKAEELLWRQSDHDHRIRQQQMQAGAELLIEQHRAENDRLREALQILYDETADYIRVNHLGDVHHNVSMQMARAALVQKEQ